MQMKSCRLLLAALLVLITAAPAFAQQTTGTIAGRVLDEQKAAVPGATVTARNDSTGFTRSEVSDAEGLYRITGHRQRLRDGDVRLRRADRAGL